MDVYSIDIDKTIINIMMIIFTLGKADMMVTSKQTLRNSQIATAAEKSARTGQPVDIVYDDDI